VLGAGAKYEIRPKANLGLDLKRVQAIRLEVPGHPCLAFDVDLKLGSRAAEIARLRTGHHQAEQGPRELCRLELAVAVEGGSQISYLDAVLCVLPVTRAQDRELLEELTDWLLQLLDRRLPVRASPPGSGRQSAWDEERRQATGGDVPAFR